MVRTRVDSVILDANNYHMSTTQAVACAFVCWFVVYTCIARIQALNLNCELEVATDDVGGGGRPQGHREERRRAIKSHVGVTWYVFGRYDW